MRRAQGAMRGSYNTDRDALREGSDIEKKRAGLMAAGNAEIAQRKIDNQAIAQMEAANAELLFSDYSAETQRQIDDVRAKRLNPNERYADSGSAAMAVIGGALGGLYQGLNRLEKNPFIEQMNKTFDQDLAVQEKNLQTQKEGIGERRHLLAEMRGTYKDKTLADAQARNLYLEGAREALAAEAAQYDSPTIEARWKQGDAALQRMQIGLDLDRLKQEAAARAAAATAAEARRRFQLEYGLKRDTHTREWAETGIKAMAMQKEAGKEHRAAVQHVGDKLAEIEKSSVGADLEALMKSLVGPDGKVDTSRPIPGVGRLADLREDIAPPVGSGGTLDKAGMVIPNYAAARVAGSNIVGLSPEERQNRGAFERIFLDTRHDITGAAFNKEEAAQIRSAAMGAKTPEEIAALVVRTHEKYQRQRNAIRAENPDATDEYERNLRDRRVLDQSAAAGKERP